MRPVQAEDDTTVVPVTAPEKPRRWLRVALVGAVSSLSLGFLAVLLLFTLAARDLPRIETLADYRPKQATVVYGKDGEIVARFATERRTVVPFDRIPKIAVDAVVAAEDAEFFQHQGVDYPGILRCLVKNTISGRKVCGGSTITQQMVKTFLLDAKKTYSRKLKELILAKRVEESLSKQDILYLYLNQINYGRAYGIQEAAQVYFGKNVEELSVAEAALLTGLPQSPARLDPFKYPERALARRGYVLQQLEKHGKIDRATHEAANAQPLNLDYRTEDSPLDSSTYYAAHVKRRLIEQFGEDRAVDGGLRVYTGIDPGLQRVAEEQVRQGVLALDKRQGYRGPLFSLELDRQVQLLEKLEARRSTLAPSLAEVTSGAAPPRPVIFDLSRAIPGRGEDPALDLIVERARFLRFEPEQVYAGLVTLVDDREKRAEVSLGGVIVELPLRTGLAWARKFDLYTLTRSPRLPSEVLKRGDVVLVRATAGASAGKATARALGVLEQTPKAEAALIALDPTSREVRAMVGGYGVGAGTFNRATQANRQAGSTFKPFLYAAALDSGGFTPVSTCLDVPHVYRDPWTGRSWKPKNYDGKFDGEITLREALTRSKNLCSVWLIHRLGVEPVIEMAQRLGIRSPMPKTDTLSLGSGDVTVLEVANAYASLAARGTYKEPTFIRRVLDREGKLLFEADSPAKPVLRPEIAYQVTSLLQSVVEDGTAQSVQKLGRPVAGKTGTTNESRNAWFAGYTPGLTTVVWVGFDDNQPLGPGETGGRAAIPIWLGFMERAVAGQPVQDFEAPSSIVFALVDPKSGRLALPTHPGARQEPFVAGTEPTELSTTTKAPENFGLDDYEP